MSMIPSNNPFEDSTNMSTSIQEVSRDNLPVLLDSQIGWKETPEAHVLEADVTGLNKEEVKVEVEDGRVLQIRGERNIGREEKNDGMHRVQHSTGKFTRSVTLPANVKLDQVKASMENGVLTVTVPKEF